MQCSVCFLRSHSAEIIFSKQGLEVMGVAVIEIYSGEKQGVGWGENCNVSIALSILCMQN